MKKRIGWPCLTMIVAMLTVALLNYGDDQSASAAPPAQPKPVVGVYAVKYEQVPLVLELPGRAAASSTAEIRPQVNGIILKRLFEEGSLVAEGESLYEINSAAYKAAYDKAMASLANLERTVARQEVLKTKNFLSAQDYENTLYAMEQAKAEAELARLNLEYCRVKAPLTGRIGRSNITEGALVTSGQAQPLSVVQQIDPIFVDLNPSVTQILKNSRAADGQSLEEAFLQSYEVTLTLEDGRSYPLAGRIKFLDSTVDPGTGSVGLRAEFPNPDGLLLPGMFVRAQVVERVEANGILIPQQALLRSPKGEAQVWVVDAGNIVEIRPITVGRTVGNTWLVTGGLSEGETVVAEGLQRLAKGMEVAPQATQRVEIKLAFNK